MSEESKQESTALEVEVSHKQNESKSIQSDVQPKQDTNNTHHTLGMLNSAGVQRCTEDSTDTHILNQDHRPEKHESSDQECFMSFERYWGFYDAALAILVTILPIKIFERVAEQAEEDEHHESPYREADLYSILLSAPLAFFIIYYIWFRLARIFEDWHYAPLQVYAVVGGATTILLQFPTSAELYIQYHEDEQVRGTFYVLIFEIALYLQWTLYFSYSRNPKKYKSDWQAGWCEIFFTFLAMMLCNIIRGYDILLIAALIVLLPIIRSNLRKSLFADSRTSIGRSPLLENREDSLLSQPPPMRKMKSIEELEIEVERLEQQLHKKKSMFFSPQEFDDDQPIVFREATIEGFRLQKERMAVFADAIYAIASMVIVLGLRVHPNHDEEPSDVMTKNQQRLPSFLSIFYLLVSFWRLQHTILDTMFEETLTPFFVVVWGINLFLVSLTSATFGIMIYAEYGHGHWASTVGHGVNILLLQLSFILIYFLARRYEHVEHDQKHTTAWWPIKVYHTCVATGWILTLLLIAIDPEGLDTGPLIPNGVFMLLYIFIIYGPITWKWLKPRCECVKFLCCGRC